MKILFFALCVLPIAVCGQSFEWVKQIGGRSHKQTRAQMIDHSGNIILAGNFSDKTDFDPGSGVFTLEASGHIDAFICKLDASGGFIWAIQFGDKESTYISNIVTDAAGNIYAAGTLKNSCDFDPGPDTFMVRTPGYIDIFLLKVSADGKLLWVKTVGGEEPDHPGGLAIDSSGALYLTGSFREVSDLLPGPDTLLVEANGWNNDVFIMKLDSAGEQLWLKYFGGPEHDSPLSLALDSSLNIIVSGMFGDTVDFDPGDGQYVHIAKGEQDIFVLKLNPDGKIMWATTLSSQKGVDGATVATDLEDNIFVTGNFTGNVNVDPAPISHNLRADSMSMFLLKLDELGMHVWSRTFKGCLPSDVFSWPLTVDRSGAVYTTGVFRDTLIFPEASRKDDLYSVGEEDPFICKYTSEGRFNWALQVDGSSYFDIVKTISLDKDENVFVTGYFDDTTFFDPGGDTLLATSKQYYDVFIAKIEQPGTATTVTREEQSLTVGISPNPFASTTSVLLQGGRTYRLTIRDILGRKFFSTDVVSPWSSTTTYEVSAKALSLIQGIYYLTVSSGNEQMTQQLLFLN